MLRASIFGASAYLKIADGCRRPCAFCAIPLIKGTAVSRPPEMILEEAQRLHELGVRELILIAQDTTDYGHDLGMKDGLATLLERMTAAIPELDWLRIMYAFPGYVTDRLIDVMASHPQILPYLDIPLQHAHPDTLTRMRRPANMDWVHATIGKMRRAMPKLAIRTVFIVGYPGETEKEFQTLLDFVEEMRFDHVGAFQFSFEPGTASEALGDPVPAEVKEERYQRLMELQQTISLQINQSYVGQTLDVLVEGFNNGIAVGRSYRDAPEIDGLVLIEPERLKETRPAPGHRQPRPGQNHRSHGLRSDGYSRQLTFRGTYAQRRNGSLSSSAWPGWPRLSWLPSGFSRPCHTWKMKWHTSGRRKSLRMDK